MRLPHALAPVLATSLVMAHAGTARAQTAEALFDSQTLHEIRLRINSRDLSLLRANYLHDTYYTADLQWRNVRVRNAGVRSRGAASRSGSKLALRIDFDRYTVNQRFLGMKSLVLKNFWQDGSMMRERLAMAVVARMGQPASRESYCRLYINDEFQGLYAVVESVDNAFLARTIGEEAGYLFAYQFMGQYYGEDLGDNLSDYKRRFEAQNHEREADAILYQPIRDLVREVNHPDDAVWRARVEEYVDLAQFVTQAAIECFLAEPDGLLGFNGMNNFYLYRLGGTTRHRFIVWDKDLAFLDPGYAIFSRADDNVLFRRALAYPDLRELYLEVLKAAARTAAEDNWLENEVVRVAELVGAAVQEDTRKPYSTETFFESVVFLRTFARERPAFVLKQIASK